MTQPADRKITKARAALICDQPFFGTLALRLKLLEDKACDTAWTDGVSLGFNPEYIEGLPMGQLVGLVAHEVMHLALCHHTRQGQREDYKWNVAADYAINQLLLKSGFEIPDNLLQNDSYDGKSAEAVYDLLGDNEAGLPSPGASGSPGEVRPMPGKPSPAEIKLEEQTWKVAVTQATQHAKAMGVSMDYGLERIVEEALFPKVDWRMVLREFMDTAVRADYCWMHPNPRYIAQGIYLPGLNSKELGNIAVAIDTSGSVSESQLGQFSLEVSAMLEEFNTTVDVIYVDRKVQGHETFTQADLPLELKLKGGGGTDFRPAFEMLEAKGITPCCLVYLTDLYCSRYPEIPPEYPVLWVNTEGDDYQWKAPPFGETINM